MTVTTTAPVTRRVDRSRVRYAVVGAGNIGQVAVLPAFEHARENSELAALVCDDAEKCAAPARRYDVPALPCAELESAIVREAIDAVYIALPSALRRAHVERAARAGAHVLCEKPMATSSRDCDAMIDACDRAAVRLMIAYPLHFDPANLRAIEIVRSGKLGEPRYFTASFSQQVRDGDGDVRTRADLAGGALFDMGIYGINAARLLFGAEPTAVVGFQARATDDRFHDVDAMTTALMHFSDDRLAHVVASHGAADVDSMRIVGTRGELRVEPAFGYAGQLKHYLTIGSRTQETTFRTGDRFAPELVHFSECLRCGAEPQPSGREGLADVRVMEALIRSAHDGRLVELAAFDPGARPEVRLEMKKPAVKPPPTARAPSPSR